MKQGSADDPFAEEPVDDEPTAEEAEHDREEASEASPDEPRERTASDRAQNPAQTLGRPSHAGPSGSADDGEPTPDDETTPAGQGTVPPQQRTLPYIHARDGVKDGRTQRPVFLRDHVEAGIDDLVDRMEDDFDETVYKTDVTEAAMAVALEHPDLVRAKLEEWGYGWT